MKRLLFLTFYFRPDLSAGSFRSSALVDELAAQAGDGWGIDVITTMPNRYSSFASNAAAVERDGNVAVNRIALPAHHSGMRDQSLAFLTFARGVRRAIRGQRYDAVFATTSRLATGVLGAWIANRQGAPLYLDVRDIFADTMEDVFKGSPVSVLLPGIRMAERYTIRTARRINVVSGGFLEYFQRQVSTDDFRVFPNGIDSEFLKNRFNAPERRSPERLMVYAGNIGDGQGLHRIVPELAEQLGTGWCIRVIGDGGKRRELEDAIKSVDGARVERLDPVPRQELLAHYREADVLFMHLNDYKAFHRVLPSKVFEYAATGKPLLAGVSGHSARFIEENIDNAAVFPPCDAVAGRDALARLEFGQVERSGFRERFSREAIVKRMASDVLGLVRD